MSGCTGKRLDSGKGDKGEGSGEEWEGHLPVRPPWGMTSTPIQLSQHVGEGIYLSIQTSWVQPPPVWGESLGIEQKQGECKSHGLLSRPGCYAPPSPKPGSYLRALGCSAAPHPGRPPILQSPGGLVTLLGWDGAKIDPGVGLECWDELKQSEDGDGEGGQG